jgi:diacylglycerol kinase
MYVCYPAYVSMKQKEFSIKSRLKSFKYAFNGLRVMFMEEHNSRIHVVAAVIVILISVILDISQYEWIAVIFSIGFVLAMELINSSIENISDFISPERNETIKKVKDLAAAGVLIAAFTALIIGLIIFIPNITALNF